MVNAPPLKAGFPSCWEQKIPAVENRLKIALLQGCREPPQAAEQSLTVERSQQAADGTGQIPQLHFTTLRPLPFAPDRRNMRYTGKTDFEGVCNKHLRLRKVLKRDTSLDMPSLPFYNCFSFANSTIPKGFSMLSLPAQCGVSRSFQKPIPQGVPHERFSFSRFAGRIGCGRL